MSKRPPQGPGSGPRGASGTSGIPPAFAGWPTTLQSEFKLPRPPQASLAASPAWGKGGRGPGQGPRPPAGRYRATYGRRGPQPAEKEEQERTREEEEREEAKKAKERDEEEEKEEREEAEAEGEGRSLRQIGIKDGTRMYAARIPRRPPPGGDPCRSDVADVPPGGHLQTGRVGSL